MQSEAAALQALRPQLLMLARAGGRTLTQFFLVLVVAAGQIQGEWQRRQVACTAGITLEICDSK